MQHDIGSCVAKLPTSARLYYETQHLCPHIIGGFLIDLDEFMVVLHQVNFHTEITDLLMAYLYRDGRRGTRKMNHSRENTLVIVFDTIEDSHSQ